jgi:ATP-dependent exoDNAse (exonuclease V) beta subunit
MKMTEIKRISFSELKIWNECPYKHKLLYGDKISGFIGNEHTAFGTAVHKVCEETITKEVLNPHLIFENEFNSELARLTQAGYELNQVLVSEMRAQAPVLCKLAIPAVKDFFEKYEVVSVEEPLLEDITEFESDKKFKGFIDLVLKTSDGKIHIIDWKTCSWGWDSRRKSDPMTTYQLAYYKNYYAKKHNINPENIETYFALLKRTAKKDNVEIFKVTSGPKKMKNSLKLLKKAVINIDRNNYIKNRLSCRRCEFYKTEHCE